MYQSYEVSSSPELGPARLQELRAKMAQARLNGFIVPHSDRYQGEYLAPRDERLAWLTGFTGSAGFCIVLEQAAGVFTDSRYFEQVRDQIREPFVAVDWPDTTGPNWIVAQIPQGVIGFDPWLHSASEIAQYRQVLSNHGIRMEPCENLIDAIWVDQPAEAGRPARAYDVKWAGQSHREKCREIAKSLQKRQQSAAVITLTDSISWLLNVRGDDVIHNPIVQAYAILHATGVVEVFADPLKLAHLSEHLGPDVHVFPQSEIPNQLDRLKGRILVDKSSVPQAIIDQLTRDGIDIIMGQDPVILPKSIKNPVELSAARDTHLRDARYMCEFLAWLEDQNPDHITEIDVAEHLEYIRRQDDQLVDVSFDTIAASGPHAALPHYRVTHASNQTLVNNSVMLIDSGGQYRDGTTDITRTVAVGTPAPEIVAAFTRVLQGMIAISRLRFPKTVTGRDIDAFARAALWAAGQDYGHGTGHGVGHHLCVHEGPQGISKRADTSFQPGMIVSNEPGYYEPGAFGIRTENLIVVRDCAPEFPGFYEFETLTYVPIDRRLIMVDMLSPQDRHWINQYHQTCRDIIGPRLNHETRLWLQRATEPL